MKSAFSDKEVTPEEHIKEVDSEIVVFDVCILIAIMGFVFTYFTLLNAILVATGVMLIDIAFIGYLFGTVKSLINKQKGGQ